MRMTIQIHIQIPKPPLDLCPVCGEYVYIDGRTKHGKLIGSCGDAFSQESWESDPDKDSNPSIIEICF